MRIIFALVLALAVAAASSWAICQIPGVVPPCQNKGFTLSSEYTGPEIFRGRHVLCFAGQIVKVGAPVRRSSGSRG